MTDAMLDGLTDYTSDERGDVGSWVRIACIKSLTVFTEILFPASPTLNSLAEYLPPAKYHDAIGGILKQGVERLDNVRQLAGECFMRLLMLPLPAIPGAEQWDIHGHELVKSLFLRFAYVISRPPRSLLTSILVTRRPSIGMKETNFSQKLSNCCQSSDIVKLC